MAASSNPSRIGVDIGGTFTDLVWVDETTGAVRVGKLLTTPKDPSQAVEEGVVTLLHEAGAATTAVRALIHGTTLATNALIERKGARGGAAHDIRIPGRGRDRAGRPLRHVRPLHRSPGTARAAPAPPRGGRAGAGRRLRAPPAR